VDASRGPGNTCTGTGRQVVTSCILRTYQAATLLQEPVASANRADPPDLSLDPDLIRSESFEN
jgi:hypothetical protein